METESSSIFCGSVVNRHIMTSSQQSFNDLSTYGFRTYNC
jgi:hypothetical protein